MSITPLPTPPSRADAANFAARADAFMAALPTFVTEANQLAADIANGVPIHAATAKSVPVDADEFGLQDSAATYGLKKVTLANLRIAILGAALSIPGGTVTASVPVLDTTQTWNNAAVAFTANKTNITDTASAAASLLEDWQVGGTSKASIRKDGLLTLAGGITAADQLNASKNAASFTAIRTDNATATGQTQWRLGADTNIFQIFNFGSTYASSGKYIANAAVLESNRGLTLAGGSGGAGNVDVYVSNTKIGDFSSGGLNITGQISASGSVVALNSTFRRTDDANQYAYVQFADNAAVGVSNLTWGIGKPNASNNFAIWSYDGSTISTAMTLDASGNLSVWTTSASNQPTGGISLNQGSGQSSLAIGHVEGTSSSTYYIPFSYNGSIIGSITQNGTTAVAYNTTSDHRLKINVRPANAVRFKDIAFRDFEWIDGRHDCGVIAHELQAIYPDLVLGEKDAVDADGNPVYQQVNYIGLICRMGTVIQQHDLAIQALESLRQQLIAAGITIH